MSKLRTDELENLSGSVTILVANLLQSSDLTATNTTYDNTSSGLTATDVQDAIDEVDSNLDSTDSSLSSHTGDDTIHRTINDAGTATTDLWSADKIGTELSGKLDTTAQAADSDLLDGQEGTYYLDRANHTGTNDADTLDGQDSPYYLDRTNHTGTQTLSTISDSGTAASADLTTSATDTTAGRVTKVGDLGWHATPSPQIGDTRESTGGGYFHVNSEVNTPPAAGEGVFSFDRTPGTNGNHYVDIGAWTAGGDGSLGDLYWQKKWQGTYQGWYKLYDDHNILGTVSQSSGVPTGAIIEQGSNSNGEYTKFADGTLYMASSITLTQATTGVLTGGWTYPVSVLNSGVTKVFGVYDRGNSAVTPSDFDLGIFQLDTLGNQTSINVRLNRISGGTNFASGDTAEYRMFAMSRWF